MFEPNMFVNVANCSATRKRQREIIREAVKEMAERFANMALPLFTFVQMIDTVLEEEVGEDFPHLGNMGDTDLFTLLRGIQNEMGKQKTTYTFSLKRWDAEEGELLGLDSWGHGRSRSATPVIIGFPRAKKQEKGAEG
jgi:hypothetical protein